MGLVLVVGLLLAAMLVVHTYHRDLRAAQHRIESQSRLLATPRSAIEFAAIGEGPPVLVIHGAGGGYDQGLAIAEAYGGEGYRWIAPSRFGYLRSPLPADSSPAAQADAFAHLLDQLGVNHASVIAMSGGVPPALQFAIRHPSRCAALVLLASAPYTPLSASQQEFPVPIWLYHALFASDFPYWLLAHLSPSSLERMFDVKPGLRSALSVSEQHFVRRLVTDFLPVTMRTNGLQNEGAAIHPNLAYPLAEIHHPTLVIHARDDGINPMAYGEYTARHIHGARLLALPSGGHLLLGHQDEVRRTIRTFLAAHSGPLP